MATADAPIVGKMIEKRKAFELAAENLRREKLLPYAKQPVKYRMSPDAYSAYQSWATELEAELIADKHPSKKDIKKAGDSNLDKVFAGLAVTMDDDLPAMQIEVV